MDAGQPKRQPVFGNYALEALVGRGGMAEVFRAKVVQGPRAGRVVALKRLLPALSRDPQYVDLFTAEADLSRMLKHPNIVEVLEIGVVGEQYYMAMEYVDGRDLAQIVRRCQERGITLPVDFAVYLGVTLLDALAYAHGASGPTGKPLNVVHCDVSPSNLFISRTGEIKLGDFGIARARAAGSDETEKVWGKAYYLSPETLEGDIAPQTDLWAAAVTLYELLANRRPFTGGDPEAVMAAIRKASPTPLRDVRPEISEALAAAVHRGLARKPSDRYPSATDFADALRPHYDERIGTPLAIAAVVRGLFGA